MKSGVLHKLAAFTDRPEGGNPAGVWVGRTLPDPGTMQRIAGEVGFSETAFVAPVLGDHRIVRYYSPEAEVSFCGHATIAAGVVLGETGGDGTYTLDTAVGEVPVTVRIRDGRREASMTSVEPATTPATEALVEEALSALGWRRDELDDAICPARAYAADLGGYLRLAKLISVPTTIHIRQGDAMGRPSRLVVQIPASGGIVVSGTAVRI